MWLIKNNRGFTLVEVLAAILILSIVSTILFSILVSSKETNNKQLENNDQLTEMSYVLKLITKDMRKTITYDPTNSTFKNRDGSVQYTYIFDTEKNTINRNNEIIATNIHSFSLTRIGDSISINIESNNEHTISTQLSFRSGDGAKDEEKPTK
ncbi:PilW family protein [Lysinibacillus cavernae]|uniref:PilW family protein n=1 Tax=Lysinibacillus cavernae TaxID=2666135 RepID=UPI0012D97B41|nr:type II secretion system protein [Lysinibacillus cavernae]